MAWDTDIWKMRRHDYVAAYLKDHAKRFPDSLADGRIGMTTGVDPETHHKFEVKKALRSGEPVPAAVLSDYPDLAIKAQKTIPLDATVGLETPKPEMQSIKAQVIEQVKKAPRMAKKKSLEQAAGVTPAYEIPPLPPDTSAEVAQLIKEQAMDARSGRVTDAALGAGAEPGVAQVLKGGRVGIQSQQAVLDALNGILSNRQIDPTSSAGQQVKQFALDHLMKKSPTSTRYGMLRNLLGADLPPESPGIQPEPLKEMLTKAVDVGRTQFDKLSGKGTRAATSLIDIPTLREIAATGNPEALELLKNPAKMLRFGQLAQRQGFTDPEGVALAAESAPEVPLGQQLHDELKSIVGGGKKPPTPPIETLQGAMPDDFMTPSRSVTNAEAGVLGLKSAPPSPPSYTPVGEGMTDAGYAHYLKSDGFLRLTSEQRERLFPPREPGLYARIAGEMPKGSTATDDVLTRMVAGEENPLRSLALAETAAPPVAEAAGGLLSRIPGRLGKIALGVGGAVGLDAALGAASGLWDIHSEKKQSEAEVRALRAAPSVNTYITDNLMQQALAPTRMRDLAMQQQAIRQAKQLQQGLAPGDSIL